MHWSKNNVGDCLTSDGFSIVELMTIAESLANTTAVGSIIAGGYTDNTLANGDYLTNHKGTLRGSQDGLIVKFDSDGNFAND